MARSTVRVPGPQRHHSSLDTRTHRHERLRLRTHQGAVPGAILSLPPAPAYSGQPPDVFLWGDFTRVLHVCLPLEIQSIPQPNFIDGPPSAFLPEATQEYNWESFSLSPIVHDN